MNDRLPAESAPDRLRSLLAGSKLFMEYGSGASTLLAGELGVPSVISTDSDLERCTRVRAQFCSSYLRSVLCSIHVDAIPARPKRAKSLGAQPIVWPLYCAIAWRLVNRLKQQPDVVLINGHYRSACLLMSLMRGKENMTILIEGYDKAACRERVEAVLKPRWVRQSTAEFVMPALMQADLRKLKSGIKHFLADPSR